MIFMQLSSKIMLKDCGGLIWNKNSDQNAMVWASIASKLKKSTQKQEAIILSKFKQHKAISYVTFHIFF